MSLGIQSYSEGCTPSGWYREHVVELFALNRRSVGAGDPLAPVRLDRFVSERVMAAVDSNREAFFADGGPGEDWADCESYRGSGSRDGRAAGRLSDGRPEFMRAAILPVRIRLACPRRPSWWVTTSCSRAWTPCGP